MSAFSGHDGINFELGKMLAMTFFEAITLAAFLLENDDLVAFDMARNNGSVYFGCVQYRRDARYYPI